MTIHLIWAEARDGVIGAKGGIPWHVPGEQAIFRERTMGATVVMGRATWDSLPERVRPLPGRHNVVLTRQPGWAAAQAVPTRGGKQNANPEVCGSVEELLRVYDDFWVMGGAAVYTALLPHADHIVRTRIDIAVPGDTFAPRLGPEWQLAAGAETRTSDTGVQYTVEELISGRA